MPPCCSVRLLPAAAAWRAVSPLPGWAGAPLAISFSPLPLSSSAYGRAEAGACLHDCITLPAGRARQAALLLRQRRAAAPADAYAQRCRAALRRGGGAPFGTPGNRLPLARIWRENFHRPIYLTGRRFFLHSPSR